MDQNIHIQQHIQRIYISTFFILCIKQRLVKSCLCHGCVPVNIKSFGNQYGFQLIRHRTSIRSYKPVSYTHLAIQFAGYTQLSPITLRNRAIGKGKINKDHYPAQKTP